MKTLKVPEGTLSSILINDGNGVVVMETILFDADGNSMGRPQRTVLDIGSTQYSHYTTIKAELEAEKIA